ncbi:hypothetical protein [Lysobacter soli]|uniref:hypothetical protein n=1 Tax=Lysobacter soli TaxID=453783 RepID=UPI002410797F|nr:hypothetical protein [Lysobacter soli]MDG2516764.1 hypothetical protein [Lysobacter soli]
MSDTLEADVEALGVRLSLRWIWRGSDWEFVPPRGYRAGPALLLLTQPVLEYFLAHWALDGAGLVVQSTVSEAAVVAHLQQLRWLEASNGDKLRFSLGATRRLEELAESLSSTRLAELLGPVQTVRWLGSDARTWQQLENAHPAVAKMHGCFTLSANEEDALDRASLDWFLRDAARQMAADHPAQVNALGQELLRTQLLTFAREAERELALTYERDIRHYMRLRLLYPAEPFVRDASLRALLADAQVEGRQRVFEAEHRLRLVYPTLQEGSDV